MGLTDQEMKQIKQLLHPEDMKQFKLIISTMLGKLERNEQVDLDAFYIYLEKKFPTVLDLTDQLISKAKARVREKEMCRHAYG